MNLNLTPEQVDEVKAIYDAWEEIGDRAKELKNELKTVMDRAAVLYECKAGKVSKLFKNMKKKMEDGEDEINDISLMEEVIKNNGE
jgi:hypothetical protein